MTTNHTPTPFHLGMKPGPMIYGPLGEQVADLCVPMLDGPEHAANAAFIVRACNAHDELVAALRQIESMDGTTQWHVYQGIARAALAKVQP